MITKYGNTKAARAMEAQDRQRDLMPQLILHLLNNPLPCPFEHADIIHMLMSVDRRAR